MEVERTDVGHDHHSIRVRLRVLDHLETDSIEDVFIIGDMRIISCYLSTSLQEHAIGHFPVKVKEEEGARDQENARDD